MGRDPRDAKRKLADTPPPTFSEVLEELIASTPVASIMAPARETSRDRVLNEDEIAAVCEAAGNLGWPFGPFVRALLMTARRRDEVARRLWVLPRELTKANRARGASEHTHARALAGRPAGRAAGVQHRAGWQRPLSGFSRAKTRLDHLIARKNAERRLCRPLANGEKPSESDALAPWRLHDLRRTAASGMAMRGHPPHVVAAVLNHSPGSTQGITAVYNRHRYGDEKRRAFEAWAGLLASIVTGPMTRKL